MALDQFWRSVRTGFQLYAPGRVISDTPRLDDESIDKAMARPELWLTRAVARDYDPADFDFLPAERRDELTRLVQGFRAVAAGLKPRTPVTEEQVREAVPFFRGIVKALEFDRFADPESFRIGKTIESDPAFPQSDVIDVRYRSSPDFTGEPRLKIMTYLPNSDMDKFLERARLVRHDINELVFEQGRPYWPHVSARPHSDLAEMPALGADE